MMQRGYEERDGASLVGEPKLDRYGKEQRPDPKRCL